MYKLFLTLRYLLHRRIVIVPIVAVMLCVATDLIVVSLMGGFVDKLRNSVRGLFGDVIIGNGSLSGFGYYDHYGDGDDPDAGHPGLLQYLEAISVDRQPTTRPELQKFHAQPAVVRLATPIIETYAVLRLPNRGGFTNPVRVVGIRADEYARVTDLRNWLFWQRELPEGLPAADQARETSSTDPPVGRWIGLPDLLKVRDRDDLGKTVSLAHRYPKLKDPVGIYVGVRVFWPTPDKQGRFPRGDLVPGDEKVQLTFLPISAAGGVSKEPVMKEFFLADTAFHNVSQIDHSVAYVPLDRLQDYLAMNRSAEPIMVSDQISGAEVGKFLAPARATRILVKLADGVPLKAGRAAVQEAVDAWVGDRRERFKAMPGAMKAESARYEPFRRNMENDMEVSIWEEANKEYFATISMQRSIAIVLVGIVSLTVVGLIWVIFIMIVVEKTKDIGIIKSVGGSAGGIASIFLAWAAVIGAIGSALGGVLGWLFVRHINAIERWLSGVVSWFTGSEVTIYDPRTYLFDTIPARFQWHEFLILSAMAIIAAVLGAVLPALRAGRMNVVDTLRYE